MTEESTH